MIKSGIYKIVNLSNGKFYIGSAVNIDWRIHNHLYDFRNNKNSPHLQNAWNLYGEDNFKFEIIEVVERKENESDADFKRRLVKDREQYYLDTLLFAKEFLAGENKLFLSIGYNINPIADSTLGIKLSEKTKSKMRENNRGSGNPMYGKKLSKESKKKMSLALKGRKFSSEHRNKLSESHSGKILSEETKGKMRLTKLGKSLSSKTRNKISKTLSGRKLSDEIRRKISESLKCRG